MTDIQEKNLQLRTGIRNAFTSILSELKNFVETETLTLPNVSILENKLSGYIHTLSTYTEIFWEELSWNKDIYSYRFTKRNFPSYNDEENKIVVTQKAEIFKPRVLTRKEKLQEIKTKYDLRDTIRHTLNVDYVDENVPAGAGFYKNLDSSRYYELVSQSVVTKIFRLLHSIQAYDIMLHMFCILVGTRELYHYILNEDIMELFFNPENYAGQSPFLDTDYLELIHHFLFYGIYLMYREECILKSYALPKHRFILSASVVQWFPPYNGAIYTNPYLPISLSHMYVHSTNVPDNEYFLKPLRVLGQNRGIYNTEEFRERFNIFTNDIFDSICMDKLWFGGSAIAACITRNPLEILFGLNGCAEKKKEAIHVHWQNQRARLNDYFDEYYPSKNVLRHDVWSQMNTSETAEIESKLSDIDIMIDVLDDNDFDKYTDRILQTVRKNLMIQQRLSQLSEGQLNLMKIETKKSYKYFISGTLLGRNLEIFRLYGSHPVGGVSRFHFPAVRGVYNGENVFLFPSLISYAYTGIFTDYKWMSSAHDAKDLILKYFTRGGVTILNETESKLMADHIKSNPDMWGIISRYIGSGRSVSLTNPMFRPRQHLHSIYSNLREVTEGLHSTHYEWIDEGMDFMTKWSEEERKSRFGFDLSLRFPSGHIKPLMLWKIGPYVKALNRSNKYNKSS
jgi:hypothetical protein